MQKSYQLRRGEGKFQKDPHPWSIINVPPIRLYLCTTLRFHQLLSSVESGGRGRVGVKIASITQFSIASSSFSLG